MTEPESTPDASRTPTPPTGEPGEPPRKPEGPPRSPDEAVVDLTPPEGPATSSEELRERMLADVMRDSAAREMVRTPWPEKGVSVRRVVFTAVATVVALWLWILPPPPLRAPPVPEVAPERLEAGMRFAIALQAEGVAARRRESRRLPDLLREAGDTLPGLAYERLDGGTFALRGTVNGRVLEYRSDTSLADFLGDAPWVLSGDEGS